MAMTRKRELLFAALYRAGPGRISVEQMADLSGLTIEEVRDELELWITAATPEPRLSPVAQVVQAVLDAAPPGVITTEEIGAKPRTELARRGLEELAAKGMLCDAEPGQA